MNHLREAIIRELLLQRVDHICSDVVFFVISAVWLADGIHRLIGVFAMAG
jgi:hypothetical protein